ncbi:M23 family metallopeptidase [Kineococcus rhizosphaerae]|nr:M23 family metallopeptidase [Kineococcus rhizosphaerae]
MGSTALTALVPLAAAGLAAVVLAPPAPAPAASAPAAPAAWAWPLEPPRVVRGFDDVARYAAGHRGVDLAAAPGQPVRAVAAGQVSFAGRVAGRGVVVVVHDDGLRTTYEPVEAGVAAGARVVAGGPLGSVAPAPAHCVTTCLHLGLRDGEVYLDPSSRLRAPAPVLLPLGRP